MASSTSNEWLTLQEASDLLGVHPATLRMWADQGQVPVARTPGGHRRFRRSDIEHLLQPERRCVGMALIPADNSADVAIAHVRQGLVHLDPFSGPGLVALSEEERLICRNVGRELAHLAVQYIARRSGHQAILDQAAGIGRAYGEVCARHHLDLSNTVRTFSFFREAVLDSICPTNPAIQPRDEEAVRIRREMRQFFDVPFYAMLDAYEDSRMAWGKQE